VGAKIFGPGMEKKIGGLKGPPFYVRGVFLNRECYQGIGGKRQKIMPQRLNKVVGMLIQSIGT
jgi:hypothetical protein